MWRDLEEEAISIGLDIHYFWTLTPHQWKKYIKVYQQKEKARLREIDTFNYILGKYIAFAVNDPKKYPKKPYSEEVENKEIKEMKAEDMERQALLNTAMMGGVINK